MLSNLQIKQQLTAECENAISNFKVSNLNRELALGFEKLLNFDFFTFRQHLKKEITANLKSYWTNPENGIDPNQKLDAILLEHYIPDSIELHAVAYGIIDWHEKEVDSIDVDMGYDYDFAKGFEQIAGITLDFFNPYISSLAFDANDALAECYRLKGMIAIHEAFYELHQERVFDGLCKNEEFYFLVGEHDSVCYAVLSIGNE